MLVNSPSVRYEYRMAFVHLHVHTQYSLLQGAIRVSQLVDRVSELQMPAVAMTDTHNLFGAIDFYLAAKRKGIQPILGCEVFYSQADRSSVFAPSNRKGAPARSPNQLGNQGKFHHLVLLCKNYTGYQNLCQMVTQSYRDGAGQKPNPATPRAWVDRTHLDRWGEGLMVLSGCLRGEAAYQAMSGDEQALRESLSWFQKRFGEDFFLELQDTPLPEQESVNDTLYRLGQKMGIKSVATTDCHYLHSDDAEAQEVLQCIEHGKNLDSDRPKSLLPPDFYLKSEEKMRERFSRYPEACDQTVEIAKRCELEFRFKDEQGRPIYHLPRFVPDDLPEEKLASFDLDQHFRDEAKKGLEIRFTEKQFLEKKQRENWESLEKDYWSRLQEELDMICRTGFAGYFLIVADFINWAKRNGIPVGPGRGSGAGSLVAYSLAITDIDPIEFKLLFERFINPERISMPDFDVDFCQDRRAEVIEYVSKRYGADNVCQIITFGKLQARAVIKDVGRVLGLPFSEMDQITKLLPDELDITIDRALSVEPRLHERMEADSRIAQVMKYAKALEGLSRNAGIHAAGVIITENPVVSYCPLYVGKDGDLVTQFDKDFAEKIGLVKFDFLGLKTLTVIDNAVKLVREVAQDGAPDKSFSLKEMNYQDPKVFELIGSGDTDGVFQVESSGMKDLCTRMQPGSLEDLTAINALYRPGPLGSGMVDDFIDRKHGRKPIQYEVPSLEPILKDTYGVILYQEQVMQIARELAGYSLGQADLLRRAMGKKKIDEMAKHREIFVKGAVERKTDQSKAEAIFDLMAKFAEYGFNKSHSAAYGVLTYQTAYLKAHYPHEFMAALMTTEMVNTDKLTKYISDARAHRILVLPPSVNTSKKRFSVEQIQDEEGNSKKAIRFALEAIKGVGGIAVDEMIENRSSKPYESVLDFCRRVSTRKVNKKVLEALCLSGSFDEIAEVNRPSLFASLESILGYVSAEQEEKEIGQSSLFDQMGSDEVKLLAPLDSIFKNEPDWSSSKRLGKEKEVVGFYLSGHPMDNWQKIVEVWLGYSTQSLKQAVESKQLKNPEPDRGDGFAGGGPGRYRPQRREIRMGGLLNSLREVMTKKGARMAFGELEDLVGKLEVVFFPEPYGNFQEMIQRSVLEAEPLLLHGELEASDDLPKLLVKSVEWLKEAHGKRVQGVEIYLKPGEITGDQLRELKKQILKFRGKSPVRIAFEDPDFKTSLELPRNLAINATPQTVSSINKIFGSEVVKLY